jgi:CRP-like cAMP-binding protein
MQEFLQQMKARFPYLTDDKLEMLLQIGEPMVLQEGETFIKIGERHNKLALVLQGLLRNYLINDKGEQITVVFATEMQILAPYKCLFLQQPASETTEAVQPSMLLSFDYNAIKKLVETDAVVNRLYRENIEQTLIKAIQRIEDFTIAKPEERYQLLLAEHGYLIEQAPLKYLASYLGINPVSLSRIRARIAKAGKTGTTKK